MVLPDFAAGLKVLRDASLRLIGRILRRIVRN